MTTDQQDRGLDERLPTPDEISSANVAAIALAHASTMPDGLCFEGPDGMVKVAPAVADLMIELLQYVANGELVTLVPHGAVLTTQQAADMLNISRPHLSKLLKNDEIPHHMVGTHRRVKFQDLLTYKLERDADQDAALDELVSLGQAADLMEAPSAE